MARKLDILLTALAPTIWGSSYLITTEMLPAGYPLTVAMLRALPAGLLLLLLVRQLPKGIWWIKVFILGALNFSLFWWLLFEAAYRLPGGVAATVGAIQPLFVIFLARAVLGTSIRIFSVMMAVTGMTGVALLTLSHSVALDPIGIAVGLAGAVSMACGTVLTRHWQPKASLLTFTAWQLTAGGLLLLPAALFFEPPLPALNSTNVLGFTYLGLLGGAITYILWFRGIAKLEPAVVSSLGFLNPTAAVLLGWIILDQSLGPWQILSIVIVLVSVWLSQKKFKTTPASPLPVLVK
ncbi:MAG: EamA family transporter [Sneathiella sp.]